MELGAALAAIALFGAGASWLVSSSQARHDSDAAVVHAQQLLKAAETWRDTSGSSGCPTVSQLRHERFLTSDAEVDDPWGNRYRIQCADDSLEVRSVGKDGVAGTADDVQVPEARSRS